ncbi:MAG: pyridoxal-phosphate dependent enzyme [Candidatus Latescibacterota bacterium]|nr:MAG: pyridoxal-phosphate dependent enzyme [Candidatus Latescibacterota bacterium]
MTKGRAKLYDKLKAEVGHTPVCEITHIDIPNGNRIFAKEEHLNKPTGSHYDRVYVELLEGFESSGTIAPKEVELVETTSGNAGMAFADAAKKLGYKSTVIIPEGVSTTRLEGISALGATIIQTPKHDFVKGAVEELRRLLTVESRKRKKSGKRPYFCPNHSRNPLTLNAMARIGEEVLDDAPVELDMFVAAVGNGSSLLGPGRVLKEYGAEVIAWDPVKAPTAFEMRNPGEYKTTFGIDPGQLGLHSIYGTGVLGVAFPFLEEAIFGTDDTAPIVDDILLVADDDAMESFSALHDRGAIGSKALDKALSLPDLSAAHRLLMGIEKKSVGRSSAGSLAVALKLCEEVKNKNILIILYDRATYYVDSS